MSELTALESRWINRARRLFAGKPDDLIVYVLDDSAIICKLGVSENEIGETVGTGLRATNMLADIHDDMDFGRR